MAIECYRTDCGCHQKDEPICYMEECIFTEKDNENVNETE
jgi:hypothetical protein